MGESLGTNRYHGTQPGGYKNLVALKFCWTCFLFLMFSPFCAMRFWGNLGGGFKHFLFSPLLGEAPQFWPIFFRWVETTNQKCTPKTDVESWRRNWWFQGWPAQLATSFSMFVIDCKDLCVDVCSRITGKMTHLGWMKSTRNCCW